MKNFRLYWYISENARESQNNINLREIKKCFEHKEGKFLLESADKVYKFECKDKEDSKSWQEAINGEMKKIKNEDTTIKAKLIYNYLSFKLQYNKKGCVISLCDREYLDIFKRYCL